MFKHIDNDLIFMIAVSLVLSVGCNGNEKSRAPSIANRNSAECNNKDQGNDEKDKGTKLTSDDNCSDDSKTKGSSKSDSSSNDDSASTGSSFSEIFNNSAGGSTASSASTGIGTGDALAGLGGAGAGGGGEQGGSAGSGDPNSVQIPQRFALAFTTGKLNDPGGPAMRESMGQATRFFHCPGDSVMVGISGEFVFEDEHTGAKHDRVFRATCQFFETGDGRPVVKTNCQTLDKSHNDAGRSSGIFQCSDGKILSGFQANYNKTYRDREFRYECCDLQTWGGKKVTVAKEPDDMGDMMPACDKRYNLAMAEFNRDQDLSKVNDQVNPIRQPLFFACPAGRVMQKISSEYIASGYDRRYSFRCCSLGVEAETP